MWVQISERPLKRHFQKPFLGTGRTVGHIRVSLDFVSIFSPEALVNLDKVSQKGKFDAVLYEKNEKSWIFKNLLKLKISSKQWFQTVRQLPSIFRRKRIKLSLTIFSSYTKFKQNYEKYEQNNGSYV